MEYPAFVKQYKPSGTIVMKQGKQFIFMKQHRSALQEKNILSKLLKGKLALLIKMGFIK